MKERRRSPRIEAALPLQQIVDDAPHRCEATSLGPDGLYMERPFAAIARRSGVVQLELPLPGTGETLWVKAEVVWDSFDGGAHGTAVRFTQMAARDRALLEAYVAARA